MSSDIPAEKPPHEDRKVPRLLSQAGSTLMLLGVGWVLYLVYGARPLVAEPWQWADDGLYLRQAEAFGRWLSGEAPLWLGPYDPVLLSKAPLFGIWMGLLNSAGIPLRLAEFCQLLVLPWLFRAAVRPMWKLSGWQMLPIVVLLVGLPFLPQEQRLLRTTLHIAVASGCLISAVGMILRVRRSGVKPACWAVSTGLFFALSYLNREETIWLLPVVASALAAVLVGAWVQRNWRPAVVAAVGVSGAFAIPVGLVAMLNHQAYGIAVTTMRRAPAFTKAHQLMTSLEPETRERYVPISTATRIRAYGVSPKMSRLQPYLEGPASDSVATNPGHLSLNGRPAGTREFFVSNFEFALRDAAFAAGAQTAPASEALFKGIKRELSAGIAAGKIRAGNHGPALMAAPMPGDKLKILGSSAVSLRKLYSLEGMEYAISGFSSGKPEELERMGSFTHTPLAPTLEMQSVNRDAPAFETQKVFFSAITVFEAVAYGVGTLTVLIFATLTVLRYRSNPACWERSYAGLVLCGSLFAFSLSMSVVNVLGFPILDYPVPYNCMGYIPLSVLGAFGLTLLMAWVRPSADNGCLRQTKLR